LCRIGELVDSTTGDIRDLARLKDAVAKTQPDIVIHLAAQSLVLPGYEDPAGTYSTNVMGTVHVVEAARRCPSVRAVVIVTSDKCYENREWPWGYREIDRLGGRDPYSSSKACAELVTSAYRDSFLSREGRCSVASARAGNVVGGGDWSPFRLVPDWVRSVLARQPLEIRNPDALRPWQHVLDALAGYLLLARRLWEGGAAYEGAWNFGPGEADVRPVRWVVEHLCGRWPSAPGYRTAAAAAHTEAHSLRLDSTKARAALGWSPVWSVEQALDRVVEWTRAYVAGDDLREVCRRQILDYMDLAEGRTSAP
jgi:CDP-glucose 4,6-dehydratase